MLVEASGKFWSKGKSDSPVYKNALDVSSMSKTGHVISSLNIERGLPSKAKYSWLTDSKSVP